MRRRLDAEMVRRRLVPSREQAQRCIAERRVRVSGAVAEKAARLVDASEPIDVAGDGPRFVSRGGEKLDAALDRFAIAVDGIDVFDAGASTGGFTDCVLQRGARHVVAVDVGFGQLHERLRADDRVEVHEHVNLRTVDTAAVFAGRRFPLLVGDLSFISLTSLVDNLLSLVQPGATMILLVKPQFEAGRLEVARGRGVIIDPDIWARTLSRVAESFASRGAAMMGCMPSPLTGTDGNVEFLGCWSVAGGSQLTGVGRVAGGGVGTSAGGAERPSDDAAIEAGTDTWRPLVDAAVAEVLARRDASTRDTAVAPPTCGPTVAP